MGQGSFCDRAGHWHSLPRITAALKLSTRQAGRLPSGSLRLSYRADTSSTEFVFSSGSS